MNKWQSNLARNGPWIALALILLAVICARARLLPVPLERDEGEYAYVGQLMLDGVKPYTLAYVIKLPGPALAYALSMAVFGQTASGIHAGLLLANLAAIVLLFLLTKRLGGGGAAVVAAATYAMMSLGRGVDGSAAHATQFVVTAALGGLLLLWNAIDSRKSGSLAASGFLFGLAFIFKQPGLIFGLFGGICLLASELRRRPRVWPICLARVALFSICLLAPFALLCLSMAVQGVFAKFWFWCFTAAGGGWTSLGDGWTGLEKYFRWDKTVPYRGLWALAALALPGLCWASSRLTRTMLGGFCLASALAVTIGLKFNPHYFVMLLPAVGGLIGIVLMDLRRKLLLSRFHFLRRILFPLFFVAFGQAASAEWPYYFAMTPSEVAASLYGPNPFRESQMAGDYIRAHSSKNDRIAVLGSEPEIYFYAQRHSATGHLSTYLLTERRPYSHAMQEQMADEIEQAAPAYIVLINATLSWADVLPIIDHTLVNRMQSCVKLHYRLCGVVNTRDRTSAPTAFWESAAPSHISADTRVFVYRKAMPAK